MPLPSPNLDDRTFADLVEEARQHIAANCPSWTDLSPGDPGIVLMEAFAYLTEIMIYRLNRVPAKSYIEFLRLMGVRLLPPAAASVMLRFKLAKPAARGVEIPRGTRVTASRSALSGEPPIFITRQREVIPVGGDHVDVQAYQCQEIQGELAGRATGAPGFTVKVARPPIVAPIGNDPMLLVGVEALADEISEQVPAIDFQGKTFHIWREVESFAEASQNDAVYVVDRTGGLITFAPALRALSELQELQEMPQALAAVPKPGREIRLWYCRGGGTDGNVAAETVTTLKDSIAGVSVTNPLAAAGGRATETLENALLRGPQELHSLRRAVTARDFELLARRSGAVSRARAFTRAQLWTYAVPGSVEIILIPAMADANRAKQITAPELQELENNQTLQEVQTILDDRRPLGTTCLVNWARYKTVKIQAKVVARPEEDPASLKKRVLDRLYAAINPLPTAQGPGWEFGKPLDVYTVYLSVLSEPGVLTVQDPSLLVDDVPEREVSAVAADMFQPNTWYAASGGTLYRSTDDGDAWEQIFQAGDLTIRTVASSPYRPGSLVFAATNSSNDGGSRVYVSDDCGEVWEERARTQFDISQTAWIKRENGTALLLATSSGLYELSLQPGSSPVQVFVTSQDEQLGYYAVAVSTSRSGTVNVAVAARKMGGVFLSSHAGKGNTFRAIGLAGEDVRVLAIQEDGERSFLWAGLAAPHAGDVGKGCRLTELLGDEVAGTWEEYNKGWIGGSCTDLCFHDTKILAATYDSGVLLLPSRDSKVEWKVPAVQSGLPLVDRARTFERVDSLAHSPDGSLLMVGNKSGVFRSQDDGTTYQCCSRRVFTDRVSIPRTWVFCSGEHEIEVVTVNEERAH
jgi:hypothetical protein